jgi:ankyrin repeat protein
MNKNEALMDAVAYRRVEQVKYFLESGADPNYTVHTDEEELNGYIQPTTPLRLVMFCISDSLLEEEDLKQFAEIAKLLLQYGADPKPAMKIAESRYGKYDPEINNGIFMEIWHIVANAQ